MFKINVSCSPDLRLRVSVWKERKSPSEVERGLSAPLVNKTKLENPSSSDSPKPGWGATTRKPSVFSAYGRRTLQKALGWLDAAKEKSELLFITLTVPGSTRSVYEVVAAHSSRLVHNFKAWINLRCASKLDCYVWEYQKRGALHLHYVVHVPDKESRGYIERHCKDQWIRQLNRLSEDSGIDVYERFDGTSWASNPQVVRTEVATVKKSVSRYMSKYLSKSVPFTADRAGRFPSPARFYGVSRPLLAEVEASSAKASYYCGENHAKIGRVLEEVRHWLSCVSINGFIESSPFPQVFSFCASFDAESYKTIVQSIRQSSSYRSLRKVMNGSTNDDTSGLAEIAAYEVKASAILKECLGVIRKYDWLSRRFEVNACASSLVVTDSVAHGRVIPAGDCCSLANDIEWAITGMSMEYAGACPDIARCLSLAGGVRAMYFLLPKIN